MGWQEIVVFGAVAAAVLWLVLDRVRRRRAKAACSSCVLNPGGRLDPARDVAPGSPAERR